MTFKTFIFLGLILLSPFYANATTYEGFQPTTDGESSVLSNQSIGQTFTAESTHTMTSLDFQSRISGLVNIKVSATTAGLPSGSVLASANNVTANGLSTATLSSCLNLTNGVMYAWWAEYVSGTVSVNDYAAGGYTGGTLLVGTGGTPDETRTRDAYFVIYGDAGTCGGGGGGGTSPLGTSTVATTTLQLIGSTTVGFGILIVIFSTYLIAYLYNSMFRKKSWQVS